MYSYTLISRYHNVFYIWEFSVYTHWKRTTDLSSPSYKLFLSTNHHTTLKSPSRKAWAPSYLPSAGENDTMQVSQLTPAALFFCFILPHSVLQSQMLQNREMYSATCLHWCSKHTLQKLITACSWCRSGTQYSTLSRATQFMAPMFIKI